MAERPLAVITHGWRCLPNWIWIPDTEQKFGDAGFETITPRMSRSREPVIQDWIDSLNGAIGDRRDVTVVAHSCSGRSALHYVEKHDNVKNLIVISAFIDYIGDEMEEPWKDFYSKPLDIDTIKSNCPNVFGLYSEDDEVISFDQAELFEKWFGPVIRFKDQGHFLEKKLPIDLIPFIK